MDVHQLNKHRQPKCIDYGACSSERRDRTVAFQVVGWSTSRLGTGQDQNKSEHLEFNPYEGATEYSR